MSEARWFLAHARQDDDADIDFWCKRLGESLTQPDWKAKVIPGRDDYQTRAAAVGGWKSWCRDVPRAEDYAGDPLFHGVVVPVSALETCPAVGKATAQLVDGFLQQGKYAYCWCPSSESFRRIVRLDERDDDSWKAWATLIFEEND
jgi:hypothetical protein